MSGIIPHTVKIFLVQLKRPGVASGKIMRRLLRELATNGDVKGDVTTLEDFSVIAKLKEQEEA
jgi:acetyl-CoA synthetase